MTDKQFWEIDEEFIDDYDQHGYPELEEHEDEIAMQPIYAAARKFMDTPRHMVVRESKRTVFDTVLSKLRTLLQEDGCSYKLRTETNELFPKGICIVVETEDFGTCSNNHAILATIMNAIDSFSASALTSNITQVYFSIDDFFVET